MGLHNDIFFKVGIKTAEEADRFSKALLDKNGDYSFKTGDLFISTEEFGEASYENGFLEIYGQTGLREIDGNNTHLLFKEIREVAVKNSVVLDSIRLTFISQENDGIHVWVDKLGEDSFSKFSKINLDINDHELLSVDEFEELKKKYDKAIWIVSVSYDEIDELIENDEDEREDPYEFSDDIISRINDIIEDYIFPDDVTAYLIAIDSENGEELYNDCE